MIKLADQLCRLFYLNSKTLRIEARELYISSKVEYSKTTLPAIKIISPAINSGITRIEIQRWVTAGAETLWGKTFQSDNTETKMIQSNVFNLIV